MEINIKKCLSRDVGCGTNTNKKGVYFYNIHTLLGELKVNLKKSFVDHVRNIKIDKVHRIRKPFI